MVNLCSVLGCKYTCNKPHKPSYVRVPISDAEDTQQNKTLKGVHKHFEEHGIKRMMRFFVKMVSVLDSKYLK